MPERIRSLHGVSRSHERLRGIDGNFQKASLIDALAYFGFGHIARRKAEMRDRFVKGNFDA
jgi:hypothetical protein